MNFGRPKALRNSKHVVAKVTPRKVISTPRRDEGVVYRSADDSSYNCFKGQEKRYTGNKRLIGIATLHKSNLIPVFEESDGSEKQYVKDLANMRRN